MRTITNSRTTRNVTLHFTSTGNYTSGGVTIGSMSTRQSGNNMFNYFYNIDYEKHNGKTNPYAKCIFAFKYAGEYMYSGSIRNNY